MNPIKNTTIARCLLVLFTVTLSAALNAETKKTSLDYLRPITVYKSPSCGCCGGWVDHMNASGFSTRIQHPENLDKIKEDLGVSPQYQACHTSVKSGYFFEGHIPAEIVQHFLKEKPADAAGLAVPGMPMGSPGMDVSGNYRPYQVLKINKDGSSTAYARVSVNEITYLEKH